MFNKICFWPFNSRKFMAFGRIFHCVHWARARGPWVKIRSPSPTKRSQWHPHFRVNKWKRVGLIPSLLDDILDQWNIPVKLVIGEVVDGTNAMWNLKSKCFVNSYQLDTNGGSEMDFVEQCHHYQSHSFREHHYFHKHHLGISKSPPALHLVDFVCQNFHPTTGIRDSSCSFCFSDIISTAL